MGPLKDILVHAQQQVHFALQLGEMADIGEVSSHIAYVRCE
jgi:hypothetical protein